MPLTLAFDVYGTLIDTSGVFATLENFIGPAAKNFMNTWRDKQLEYSFRRGLMDKHVDFSVVTENALDFCCTSLKIELAGVQKKQLMEEYKTLPAFADVKNTLPVLKEEGHRIIAFSNGSYQAVKGLLEHAQIIDQFEGIVSCEEVSMFKPSPKVYHHFCNKTKSKKTDTWLISGNSFDVIGAISYGMNGAWIKRSPEAVFDPWEFEPTATVNSLSELINLFEK